MHTIKDLIYSLFKMCSPWSIPMNLDTYCFLFPKNICSDKNVLGWFIYNKAFPIIRRKKKLLKGSHWIQSWSEFSYDLTKRVELWVIGIWNISLPMWHRFQSMRCLNLWLHNYEVGWSKEIIFAKFPYGTKKKNKSENNVQRITERTEPFLGEWTLLELQGTVKSWFFPVESILTPKKAETITSQRKRGKSHSVAELQCLVMSWFWTLNK